MKINFGAKICDYEAPITVYDAAREAELIDRSIIAAMQIKKQQLEPDMSIRLVPNTERSMSRLYIVTLLILLICRVHHAKCWA